MYVDVCCARGPRGIGNVQCRAVSDHSSRPPPTPPPRLEPGSRHLRTPRTLRTPGQPSDCSNFRGSRAMYVEMYYAYWLPYGRPGRPNGRPANWPQLGPRPTRRATRVTRAGRLSRTRRTTVWPRTGTVWSDIPGCVTRYNARDPGMITRLTAYTRTGSDNRLKSEFLDAFPLDCSAASSLAFGAAASFIEGRSRRRSYTTTVGRRVCHSSHDSSIRS